MPRTNLLPRPLHLLLALGALALTACGDDASVSDSAVSDTAGPDASATQLPEQVEIPDPDRSVTRLEAVEDLTEEVADRLLAFSDKVRRRDFAAAADWLTPGFHGHRMGDLPVSQKSTGHLDVEFVEYETGSAPVVGGDEFLESLKSLIGPWSSVNSAIFKVKGAEFQRGRGERWGKIKLYVHITGVHSGGGGTSLTAWGWGRVERPGDQWQLARFQLDSLKLARRAGPVFSNVTTAAGLGHVGVRFGKPGNTSFAFNGTACGDVNGDGRWDLFVPSDGRNFLYLGTDEGTFSEEAEARGVAQPDAGTGAVFFDFDNDGDQDLAVGHVGWREGDELAGRTIELYVNDGEGHFEASGVELGLAATRVVAYSLTTADFDGDGWLDLFVCGYGMLEREHNNSWIEATNGSPNAFFRNLEGKGFEEVAEKSGVRGSSWSYASAAADWDGDGDVDLYVANDYGTNRLYQNQGDGTFVDVAGDVGVRDQGNGMGVSFGDLSGNGELDLYVSNMSSTAGNRILGRFEEDLDPEIYAALKKSAAGNTIFFQDGEGGFEKRPKSAGGLGANWAWSSALADFDLDGALDIFCTNGFVTGDLPFDT